LHADEKVRRAHNARKKEWLSSDAVCFFISFHLSLSRLETLSLSSIPQILAKQFLMENIVRTRPWFLNSSKEINRVMYPKWK
jgi:hypothetical protein